MAAYIMTMFRNRLNYIRKICCQLSQTEECCFEVHFIKQIQGDRKSVV